MRKPEAIFDEEDAAYYKSREEKAIGSATKRFVENYTNTRDAKIAAAAKKFIEHANKMMWIDVDDDQFLADLKALVEGG